MVFAELDYPEDYTDFHHRLAGHLHGAFRSVQSGLQTDSWFWVFLSEDKVRIDTFESMKHQIKSARDGLHVQQVIASLQSAFQVTVYPRPRPEVNASNPPPWKLQMQQDEASAAAQDYLAHLAQLRPARSGPADPDQLADCPANRRLNACLDALNATQRDAVVAILASALPELADPFTAALLACQLGGLVEDGADPVHLAEALRLRLPTDYASALNFVAMLAADSGKKRPGQARRSALLRSGQQDPTGWSAWAALELNTPAAMAVWCRHRGSRRAAAATPGLRTGAAQLGAVGGYCAYVAELLEAADGIQLTVLAPEQQKGFVVELEVVRNAAHLFALLEDTLVGDPRQGLLVGPRPSAKVAAVARGGAELDASGSFPIGWHYEYWWGLQPEAAARARGLDPQLVAMIGVEATVHDLPACNGQPVVLMRPRRMQRRCDLGLFAPLHDALRSQVAVLRQLSGAEVASLCKELQAAAALLD